MIKRTLYFGNPAYLSTKHLQLIIRLPEVENNSTLPLEFKESSIKQIPIEDIGVVMLDNPQITITHGVIEALLDNNVALITCDSHRMPSGLMLPLSKNVTQSERFREQIGSSLPLKKQLWQQTVQAKILNQAGHLFYRDGLEHKKLKLWAKSVNSGDSNNIEGRAAAYYWQSLFGHIDGFKRERDGIPPNNLLNYGYAILRAVIARSLVGSGLLPTLGIHHHNRYNAYCLADDIMEPYRPYVDRQVVDIVNNEGAVEELTPEIKKKLLIIPVLDVTINDRRRPLMIAAAETTSSLYKCFTGELRKISYPTM